MILCEKCGYEDVDEINVELHHIMPKCVGGKDSDGRKYLCKKCHHIWHNMLPKFIFKFVPKDKRDECKNHIKQMFFWYIKKNIKEVSLDDT